MIRGVQPIGIAACVFALLANARGAEPPAAVLLPGVEHKDAYAPSAAYGKDGFLVAWQAGRLAKGDLRKGVAGESDIVAVRVDRAGKALDAKPFVVSTAKHMRQSARVAFGGGVFLVVWHDLRNGKDWDVYAARVSPEGKVLDPEGVPVAAASHSQALPRVVWDGSAFLIVWQDYRSGERYEVYGARVSAAGKVLDPGGNRLESAPRFHRYAPALATAGDGKSLMFWNGNSALGGGTVAGGVFVTEGKPAGTVAIGGTDRKEGGPGFEYVPLCLAAGPKSFLIAWTTDNTLGRDGRPGDANASILDPDGKRTASLTLAGKPQRTRDPDAAWDGSGFVAVWHEAVRESREAAGADAVFTSRIAPDGKVSNLRHLAGSFASPAAQTCVATDGAGLSLAAYEQHAAKGDVPIQIGIRILTAQ